MDTEHDRIPAEPETGAGAEEAADTVALIADVASSFTYASYQNAIPVIRSILLENRSHRDFEACLVELTSSPSFIRSKTWTIDRLLPGDQLPLTDRKVEFDASYLAGLNEAERGEITLRLSSRGAVVEEKRLPVRLLARDEWGGAADMAQLLPAFVLPNDPGIASLLRAAAERLVAHGHAGGLDGYQSQSPQRAYMLTAAIYSAISGLGIVYSEPPASFESRGQKIRRPGTIAEEGLATCLDTSLLFAATLEAAGLHPVVLMFNGHAAVGVWLTQRTFTRAIETDPMEVRKAVASHELAVFETTGVTHRPAMTMEAARQVLVRRLQEQEAGTFVAAIDIKRSRSNGITPLASHTPLRRGDIEETSVPPSDLPLPAAPAFEELPAETIEVKPTTATGRIDRWQKKLLDLTLRNRLLNFPDSRKTIPFLCTNVAFLEDRLADGAAIRLISLPEQNPLGERDAALYRDVHGRDLQHGFATDALARDELPSPLDVRQLEARLIDLHRQVRNDFAEGGANTLFLAVGFLRWKKKPEDERNYRAPLLLVPVKLERRSASSNFSIRFHEDEPRFNATLLQFLARDFDLVLPQFSGDLPKDDSGIDVPLLLNMMRQAVRDVPGMEVLDETALSTFSFAKFLMWKDLVERTDALRLNRVVRHLIDTPEQAFHTEDGRPPICAERDLDKAYAPADIVSLLPSDSSQTAASVAAAEGHDFVIVGPPGTGKSQTIANMIANCLATGKTVLFVAEKTAALDVVYRRLREHGLGSHCIELHSSKTDRKHFLGQLKAAWEHNGQADAAEWIAINNRLKLQRDKLNAYAEALHKRYPNGLTPYQALGIALKSQNDAAPDLSWPEMNAHDAQTLQELAELAAELGRVFEAVEKPSALKIIEAGEWSAAWQDSILTAARALLDAIECVSAQSQNLQTCLDLPPAGTLEISVIKALAALSTVLQKTRGHDVSIALDPDFAHYPEALSQLTRPVQAYREAEQGLSASYPQSSVRELDPDALSRQWREANASLWPISAFGRRKAGKLLQSYAEKGKAKPEHDLPRLRQMKESLEAIDGNALSGKGLPIDGPETDLDTVKQILDLARELRDAVRLQNLTPEKAQELLSALAPSRARTGEEDLYRKAGEQFLNALRDLNGALQGFSSAAGRQSSTGLAGNGLMSLKENLVELFDARHLLRDWSVWNRLKSRAIASNLAPLVELIEKDIVPPGKARDAFLLGYARWWAPKILDADPVLRDFRRFQHENTITEFREIDDLVRSHSAQRVITAIAHGLPPVQSVPRNSELGLLRHQMELQRPSQSIRDMIGKMPQNFSKLAPCMLMSPLSIAQYLPHNHALFDVVIFDEASQITTWDAVGAIARARQTIIVGDPKQLPPTNFFGRNESEEDVLDHEKDLESILDEAKAAGIPLWDLRWHYRSRSESLIAFSNHHYYQNRLVTFPSPMIDDRAVRLHRVPNGIYDRGKSRTNRIEAEVVVTEAVSRLKEWLTLDERDRPTLGIITFNVQQQILILDLLDAARRENADLEWFFAEDRIEPVIVKNLENVQGDERDVILFSITFWQDAAGKKSMDFGALNRDGGERRLNVAVTRARQELVVFSGFSADLIDTTRTKALAVQHLKAFLDYAERGTIALSAQETGSQGGFESPFEEAVSDQLKQRGWHIVPQVGISGFRIDIGVRHPDRPGAYLAGVECDGATYHRSATARDRDKVREQVLKGLGWNMLRVWSTDWWFDASGCAERLHANLEKLLEDSRLKLSQNDSPPSTAWDMGHEVEEQETPPALPRETMSETRASPPAVTSKETSSMIPAGTATATGAAPPTVQSTASFQGTAKYRITDLSRFPADPELFFEPGYQSTISRMIAAIMETESPLRSDVLAQRVARAHGWLRTGGRIREQINLHLRAFDKEQESSGEFVWKKNSSRAILPFRNPDGDEARRNIADIPLAELASAVLENPAVLNQADPALALARLLGVERLAAVSRSRLDEAIARAHQHRSTSSRQGYTNPQ